MTGSIEKVLGAGFALPSQEAQDTLLRACLEVLCADDASEQAMGLELDINDLEMLAAAGTVESVHVNDANLPLGRL